PLAQLGGAEPGIELEMRAIDQSGPAPAPLQAHRFADPADRLPVGIPAHAAVGPQLHHVEGDAVVVVALASARVGDHAAGIAVAALGVERILFGEGAVAVGDAQLDAELLFDPGHELRRDRARA